jgi:hypothetical protein
MEITNIKVVDHQNGLVTEGIAPELDSECNVIHQKFLEAHRLTYWQLVVVAVFATSYVMIFSCAPGVGEKPNYKLGNMQDFATEISETLEAHHHQWSLKTVPKVQTD